MKKVDLDKWERYFHWRNEGYPTAEAAKRARISQATAFRFERGDESSTGLEAAQVLGISMVAGNPVAAPLNKQAQRALTDFAYFRMRYFGRRSTPWQVKAAYAVLDQIEQARATNTRRFVVMNEPPGSGKSTLFTHDIVCWMIARDRTIRIMIGSRTERQARMYVGRVRRSLERDIPLRADSDAVEQGRAFDAEATLSDDYGMFKPENRADRWANSEFTVRQTNGIALDDKENTVSAWGMDSGFLGGRFDLVVWDDLVDRKNTKTDESREALMDWWDSEAETRIEPGGVLLLQGQRIAPRDLYRYALDKKVDDADTPKYVHVMFKAHDEELCHPDVVHEAITKPWPESCLLDPVRLPWSFLQSNKRNNPKSYALQYQQEDHYGSAGLVREEWITGGVDEDGYPAPGCLDKDRAIGVIPPHLLDGGGFSFVTVDPSPTEWWGVIWWLYDPVTTNRYIVDMWRRRMAPQDFITIDYDTAEFSGLITEIRDASIKARAPITHVVVEINAAQRWLLQQPHVQRWQQATGVTFLPHSTNVNKADPKYGVESIGDLFRQGQIRLPYQTPASREKVSYLVNELLRYPGDTTDLVMSTWFHTLTVNNVYAPRQAALYRRPVPGWVSRGVERNPRGRGLPWAG
jgi:hypothetical protein